VGTLEKPAPLWGEKAKAKYQADKKAAAAAADAAKEDNGPPEPLPRDPRDTDPNLGLTPPRAQPIPGQAQSPFGTPPAGALPDPFAHPQ
jgi:hypothetical protein